MNSRAGSSSTDTSFEISYADIKNITPIGLSVYGAISCGKWRGMDVCVKSCGFGGETKSELEKLENMLRKEYNILRDLHTPRENPDVVKLLGIVLDAPGNLMLVTEFMHDCSLRHLQRQPTYLSRRKKLKIALDAAKAVLDMHARNRAGIDFVYTNLLLDLGDPIDKKCKLGDITLFDSERMPGDNGSVRWTAPEFLRNNNGNFVGSKKKADIYAFGITMWEVCTLQHPHQGMTDEAINVGVIRDGLRPSTTNLNDPEWRTLMEQCWSELPKNRPASFNEIVGKLDAMWKAA